MTEKVCWCQKGCVGSLTSNEDKNKSKIQVDKNLTLQISFLRLS